MSSKKMLVLGLDGFDPTLAEKFIAEGLLPHFKKLAESGSFARVATSNPPQSPVAWSCLISGTNPGQHDVFDFVIRDPKSYMPEIGMTERKKTGMKDLFSGLTGPAVSTRRKGEAFWDVLGKNHVKSVVLRMPVSFPATQMEGRLLTGMGTPDIRGTQGMFTFFTTTGQKDPESRGRITPVAWKDNVIETEAVGPRVQGLTGPKDATVPIRIQKLKGGKIKLTVSTTAMELGTGEWSPWVRLTFKANVVNEITGICRFHLNSADPGLELFMTPVNIDPQAPAMPISYPTEYARELFEKVGNYYTQGMPYDTWAMNEGKLTEEKFLEQAYSILDENLAMMRMELDRFDAGLVFCYFGITDLISHMFWRYSDPEHPKKGVSTNPAVKNAIRDIYKRMDEVLGEAMTKVGPDTAILVISDHGFGSFRRSVHVNSWLRDNGFLALKDGAKVGADFLTNVDWAKTRAYSVGFGGIYINQFGREKDGIVYKGAETEQVKKEISDKFAALKDSNGAAVVKRVYTSAELYSGPYAGNGPDLFIGFDTYYRASWQSGLGSAPKNVIEDNDRLWGGDHLCDPSLVPGVIFSNLKLNGANATLLDIGPTILKHFGLPAQADAEGKPLN